MSVKLYYPSPDELQGAKPLNELLWFPRYQGLLVALMNTREGRDLLCIDQSFPKIVEVSKIHVKGQWENYTISDFRVGAKWGNIIRYRWKEVKAGLDRMMLESVLKWPRIDTRGLVLIGGGTTTEFFPDPDTESTSVDGHAFNNVDQVSFTAIRDASGAGSSDSQEIERWSRISTGATTDHFDIMTRAFLLFDTAALDTVSILSATCEFVGNDKTDDFGGSIRLVEVTIASNTAVVAADYQGTVSHTTAQATDLTVASIDVGGSAYNVFTLNATGIANIDNAGVTKFGGKSDWDADNTSPTWASVKSDLVRFKAADNSGTSIDPKLVVIQDSGENSPLLNHDSMVDRQLTVLSY